MDEVLNKSLISLCCKNYFEKRYNKEIRKLLSKNFLDLPECKSCSLVTQCRRCHGQAYLFTGDLKGIDKAACIKAKIVQELSETVREKED